MDLEVLFSKSAILVYIGDFLVAVWVISRQNISKFSSFWSYQPALQYSIETISGQLVFAEF